MLTFNQPLFPSFSIFEREQFALVNYLLRSTLEDSVFTATKLPKRHWDKHKEMNKLIMAF